MTKVTTINPAFLKALRLELNEAIKPVAQKYGIAMALGNASFTETMFHYKLEGVVPVGDGEVLSVRDMKAAEDYKRLCTAYGLKLEWLGREFQYGGRTVKLVGIMPKRTKFPILVNDIVKHENVLLPYEPVLAILSR